MARTGNLLKHVLDPAKADLSVELARYILTLDFPAVDHARYAELAARAQDGTLAPEERADLEEFLDVDDFLTIMRLKARTVLREHSSAA